MYNVTVSVSLYTAIRLYATASIENTLHTILKTMPVFYFNLPVKIELF